MQMNNYTPIFAKIVDSSVWELPDWQLKIFLTMLMKKDPDYVVRASSYTIARWALKTREEVEEALVVLSSPDPARPDQRHNGRRIEKVGEDEWLILNGALYQQMMNKVNRREYKRQWQSNKRAEDSKVSSEPKKPAETQPQYPDSSHALRAEVVNFGTGLGMTMEESVRFFNHYDAVGWKTGNKPIMNWKGLMKSWAQKPARSPQRTTSTQESGAGTFDDDGNYVPTAEEKAEAIRLAEYMKKRDEDEWERMQKEAAD